MRTIRIIGTLLLLGVIGLLGYGYFGDMAPSQREITIDLPVPGG